MDYKRLTFVFFLTKFSQFYILYHFMSSHRDFSDYYFFGGGGGGGVSGNFLQISIQNAVKDYNIKKTTLSRHKTICP